MADVSATLAAWSSTTASNNPSGATTIGTGLDDNLREIQGVLVRGLSHKGSDIASANGAIDIGAVEGLMHDITGALAITGFGTVRAGILKILKFEAAATLTHNATSLILPGAANIVCADGDVGIFISEGSGNWRCLGFMRTNGSHLGPVLATEQASTSGTAINFTGIPPWVKKITLMLDGVSTNGTSALRIQLGDSGDVETTGYSSTYTNLQNASAVEVGTSTSGFDLSASVGAGDTFTGTVTFTLMDTSNTWIAAGTLMRTGTTQVWVLAGSKATSATLDRVRLTTAGGTDAFDAGAVNVLYE